MGHFGKLHSIENGIVNTTFLSSSIDILNAGTNFMGLSIHARDFLKGLSKVGEYGYKIYGFHHYSYNHEESEVALEMKNNPLGRGHLFNDSEIKGDVFTPFGSISININYDKDKLNPFKATLKEVIEDANSPYEYIIDYDSEQIVFCVEDEKNNNYKIQRFAFDDLDNSINSPKDREKILDTLMEIEINKDTIHFNREDFKDKISDALQTSEKLIINADLNNKEKFGEIIKNNMYIFNKAISKEDLLIKVEKDILKINEKPTQKQKNRNRRE